MKQAKHKNQCKALPSVDELRELFKYDPESGKLFWLPRPREAFQSHARWLQFSRHLVGRECGCKHVMKCGTKRYMQVGVTAADGSRRMFMVHRICAALGGLPINDRLVVDHINGDVWDNRLENLRLATTAQNAINCKPHRDKKSGLPRGVYQQKGKNGFFTRISLGHYHTVSEAAAAVEKAAKLFHGHFARFD